MKSHAIGRWKRSDGGYSPSSPLGPSSSILPVSMAVMPIIPSVVASIISTIIPTIIPPIASVTVSIISTIVIIMTTAPVI